MTKLNEHGRCCGRKPIFYKGGSWSSPPGAPLYFCCECCREFGPDGAQRENWAWKRAATGELLPQTPKARRAHRAGEKQ